MVTSNRRRAAVLGVVLAMSSGSSRAAEQPPPDAFADAMTDYREGRQGAALNKMLLFVSSSASDPRTEEALRVIWKIAHAAKDAEKSIELRPESWRRTVATAKAVIQQRRDRAEKMLQDLDAVSTSLSQSTATLASLRVTSLAPAEFDFSEMNELARLRAESRLGEIRESLKKIINDPSSNPDSLHEAQGYFWLYQGDVELAVKEWKEAMRINPANDLLRPRLHSLESRWNSQKRKEESDHEALLGIGDFKVGQHAKAVSRLNKALDLDPGNAQARRYLALAQSASEAASTQARVQALMIQGRERYAKGILLEAVQSWVDVLALDPQNAEARRFLERTRKRLTVKSQAPEPASARPAKREYSREKAEEFYSLGLIQYAEGDLKGAAAAFSQAVLWQPDMKKAQQGLDQAQAEMRSR